LKAYDRKTKSKLVLFEGVLETEGGSEINKKRRTFLEKLHFETGGHIFGIGETSSKVSLEIGES
jgi:hypothetical protein